MLEGDRQGIGPGAPDLPHPGGKDGEQGKAKKRPYHHNQQIAQVMPSSPRNTADPSRPFIQAWYPVVTRIRWGSYGRSVLRIQMPQLPRPISLLPSGWPASFMASLIWP